MKSQKGVIPAYQLASLQRTDGKVSCVRLLLQG